MAGMEGFGPPKCRSQSPVPYHLATSLWKCRLPAPCCGRDWPRKLVDNGCPCRCRNVLQSLHNLRGVFLRRWFLFIKSAPSRSILGQRRCVLAHRSFSRCRKFAACPPSFLSQDTHSRLARSCFCRSRCTPGTSGRTKMRGFAEGYSSDRLSICGAISGGKRANQPGLPYGCRGGI